MKKTSVNKYTIYILLSISTVGVLTHAGCSANDFFAKDPQAVYEKFGGIDYVIEIPGYKLDPQSALRISIEGKEYELAQRINPRILEKAKKYIEHTKTNTTNYHIYAAKDLGNYILLYFNEPEIADGGFEMVYSKTLEKIIGFFSAGYRG